MRILDKRSLLVKLKCLHNRAAFESLTHCGNIRFHQRSRNNSTINYYYCYYQYYFFLKNIRSQIEVDWKTLVWASMPNNSPFKNSFIVQRLKGRSLVRNGVISFLLPYVPFSTDLTYFQGFTSRGQTESTNGQSWLAPLFRIMPKCGRKKLKPWNRSFITSRRNESPSRWGKPNKLNLYNSFSLQ